MTKKRIADLLKEEVEKPAEENASTATDSDVKGTRKRSSSTAQSAAAQSAGQATAKKTTTAQTKSAKAAAAKMTATAKPAAKSASDRQLTAKITKLEAALSQSAEKASALQTDVDTHQNRIFELKDSLEKAESDRQKQAAQLEKLTAELKEAKQVILKLSEANQAANQAADQPSAEEPAAQPAERQSLKLRRPYTSYKSIPEYAIQRGTPAGGQNNSMLSDDDIGWVD